MKDLLQKEEFSPQLLIDYLKTINNLKIAYEYKIRHYTLERHTLIVISEFEKYFSSSFNLIDKGLFRLILALHDIGKPKAFSMGDISTQYHYTVSIVNKIRGALPFDDSEINLLINLVDNDSLGLYLQGKLSIQDATNQIIGSGAKAQMSTEMFFKLVTVYYQCDTASYTADAGGLTFLEHLFEYDNGGKIFESETGMLKFSHHVENKYATLKKMLIQ